ncbi:ABC transporter permease [Loigolactobacillus backii]|uniref:ABC transporter permease n=1 Tax=Loigolactobacillus backii TaxID=375175 RepID=UPI000C1CAA84|nr:ABC transporter permease subunit [Loigolactobacillus backii]MDA5386820.1 ABC transporter permease subunit [Loigolactobacillus backii]MDA5389395.1 ABC transporter permease subunit [Loigolactobacillus backii]PIO82468.1 polyamine ABC transporter permease [Loigolactobacillus backii]
MPTKRKIILLLSPFYLFFTLFFFSAVLKSFVTSLGYYPIVGLKKISFQYYVSAFHSATFLAICERTFLFALFSTAMACLVGLGLAFLFNGRKNNFTRIFFKIAQLPVMLPHIFIVLALLQLISQTGLIPSLLVHLGIMSSINHFPLLVNDPLQIGIILTYLWKEIPFVIVSLVLVLRQMDDRYKIVAVNLGATKWQNFWHISLPLIQPALINAFIINFAFNFGSYEVPYLLGNQQRELLPVYIYDLYVQGDLTQLPLTMSLNLILSLFSILFAGLLLKIGRFLPGGHTGGSK